MNTLNLVTAGPAVSSGKPATAKPAMGESGEPTAFSMLLGTLAAEAPASESAEEPPASTGEALEEGLAALQSLPLSGQPAETQELVNELLSLFSGLKGQPQGTVAAAEGGSEQRAPDAPAASEPENPTLAKLAASLKQLTEALQEQTETGAEGAEAKTAASAAAGISTEKTLSSAPEEAKTEQVIKKLLTLMEELEQKQTVPVKPAANEAAQRTQPAVIQTAALSQRTVTEEELKLKQPPLDPQRITGLKAETAQNHSGEALAKVQPVPPQGVPVTAIAWGESGPVAVQPDELPKAPTSSPAVQLGGEETAENAPQGESKPVLTVSAETVRAGQAQAAPRTEPTPPPTIRLANLPEELGEVFRQSMRFAATSEGTQIRVNITPEHLGHLDIRLTEMGGKIAAQIFTSSLIAKEALELQVSQLRQTLTQQGFTVDRIEILQQSSQQSLNQQQAQSEQRFAQQQKQHAASRDQNAYLRSEEEAAERSQLAAAGLMKVDYTV